MINILAISGSLRAASFNSVLLREAQKITADKTQWQFADISDLPLYNQELDGDTKPPAVERLLTQIREADALAIATPEYNYGIPGGLKNAIDWVSRPAYQSVLVHKPALIMSASMGPAGGARVQGQLKQVLAGTLTPIFLAPEFTVSAAQQKITDGVLNDSETRTKLERLVEGFIHWLA